MSRWLWIIKWLMLIPHYIILVFLWLAFVVLTIIAYFAVLFTGRYPKGFHDFNVGVLRWGWRVNYYGHSVFGTDRYPPFTLKDVQDYPARLEIDYPESLPRWRSFFAWLLAIPHLLIVGAFSSSTWAVSDDDKGMQSGWIGLISILALVAVLSLLFTHRYPKGLYDFLLGLNRWALRTVAYVSLLTGTYPPFRLDNGDDEPVVIDDDRPGGNHVVSGSA